jgi:tetratricopeptide (TPR) repeat protein
MRFLPTDGALQGQRVFSYARWLLFGLAVAVSLPSFLAALIANFGALALLKAEPCPPGSASCSTLTRAALPVAWNAGSDSLNSLHEWLGLGKQLAPQDEGLRLRTAETLFAQGRAREAAAMLPRVELQLPDALEKQYIPAARSRLLLPGTYENYLIAAYQLSAAGSWEEAVTAFRLALSHGAAYMKPVDHQAYFDSLAQYHIHQYDGGPGSAREIYLAGKYCARAGRWIDAEGWLRGAMQAEGWGEMAVADRAGAYLYLGEVREEASDLQHARDAYGTAAVLAPTLREPRIRLLQTLVQLGEIESARQIEADLSASGPTYKLGEFGGPRDVAEPGRLANGWALIGYDVDEESLAAGGEIEMWLWWKGPPGVEPQGSGWLKMGDYRLQRQSVVNLAPNPGFEWGALSDGFPLGIYPMWDVSFGNVGVETSDGPIGVSKVMYVRKVTGVAAVMSKPVPAEGDAYYLSGFWVKSDAATLEFRCSENAEFGFRKSTPPSASASQWLHMTYFGKANPDPATGLCVAAFQAQSGTAEWDQVMIVRLAQLP